MTKKSFTELEQFDWESGDYDSLSEIHEEFAKAIGEFLITFSALEHAINLIVSDMISDRSHEVGYRMLASLTMKNKIDFLGSILLRFISVTDQDNKRQLFTLKARLGEINSFRNKVVHANWGTLKKDGTVRTKITLDNEDGSVKFENVKITAAILRGTTNEVDSLIEELDDFFMEARNAVL